METKTKNQEKVSKITRMDHVSKSSVMKRAWLIFRSGHSFYSLSFSASLERAWMVEKANIAFVKKERIQREQDAEVQRLKNWWASVEYKAATFTPSVEHMESYYKSGVYSGD